MPYVTLACALLIGSAGLIDLLIVRRLKALSAVRPNDRQGRRRWFWRSEYKDLSDPLLNRLALAEKLLAIAAIGLVVGAFLFQWYLNFQAGIGRR